VNSIHHQACKDVPKPFRAVAFAPDGVIEAIESAEHTFLLGIQWHPERLRDRGPHMRLFEALVAEAKK